MNSDGFYLRPTAMLPTLLLAALATCQRTVRNASQTPARPNWILTWSDEFNGPDGSRPDPAKWKFNVGGNGWGNHELEYNTSRP